jgi:hypothetical protein
LVIGEDGLHPTEDGYQRSKSLNGTPGLSS